MHRLLIVIFVLSGLHAMGQDGLFGTVKKEARKGFIIGVNGDIDFPGADMAKRYGTSYRVGGQVLYKTKSNWVIGPKYDYMFGTNLRIDSLMINIMDQYGSFISSTGERTGVTIYERGYMVGLQGGRIFNIDKHNSDNGIMLLTTLGFMEHKVLIRDRDDIIVPLKGDYKKGYDRLTNGWMLEQYIGYTYFANNNLLNFHIGLNVAAGFTKGRRDFLYDVRRTDNAARVDLLFGIRAGWY
ncbi:MAG: hypothetical protein KDC07_03025, partial [Chitinophagaceae bacterium]|nr:hypothetical protein [Chitinophagaceae bacterium]